MRIMKDMAEEANVRIVEETQRAQGPPAYERILRRQKDGADNSERIYSALFRTAYVHVT